MSFSSAERFEAHQERDIELVKEAGKAVKNMRDSIVGSSIPIVVTSSLAESWVSQLDSALTNLRELAGREQKEIDDYDAMMKSKKKALNNALQHFIDYDESGEEEDFKKGFQAMQKLIESCG